MILAMSEPGISRMLLEAFRAIDADVEAALADRGASDLTPSQAAAILLIGPQGIHLTELAEQGQITKQAMMQVVDELERQGFLRRTTDPSDARAKIVRLTPKGTRAKGEARRAVNGVETRIRRRLGDSRYEALRASLARLSVTE